MQDSDLYSDRIFKLVPRWYDCIHVLGDYVEIYLFFWWAGSSVGIATDYGLDGQGSNPGGDEIFRLSRPALGPTQPPVKWVPGLSRWQSAARLCC